MLLLAVSGGPDSMLMLNDFQKSKIVVAHVNYHARKESNKDEEIVREYCKKHNIPFELKNAKFNGKSNFEAWAREVRYSFFKTIYKKYKCEKLLTAHHKDDFVETALMQQRSGREPRFFGINKRTTIDGMKVYRPYINSYWKSEIMKTINKYKIDYVIDKTNLDPKFSTRNKIRAEIKSWDTKKKKSVYSWFRLSNKILKKKYRIIDKKYVAWEQSMFQVKEFRKLHKFKTEIVFMLINDKYKSVKLSKEKINSIISFIESNKGNVKYKLDDKNHLFKKGGKLVF